MRNLVELFLKTAETLSNWILFFFLYHFISYVNAMGAVTHVHLVFFLWSIQSEY